jgi:antitoxin FitA
VATITIRNLDDGVQQRLKRRAAAHNRSMEAEVRAILGTAVGGSEFLKTWFDRFAELRGDEIPLPDRSQPREVDLS